MKVTALLAGIVFATGAGAALCAGAPPVTVSLDNRHVVVEDAAPLLAYRHGGVAFKPYVEALYSPAGVNVLLDGPEDHKHHHGLMYAMRVEGVNFWEEHREPGVQSGDAPAATLAGGTATITQSLSWLDPAQSKELLAETRRISVTRAGETPATVVTWESEFRLPDGAESAEFAGAHYHGLGMRFVRDMDEDGTLRFEGGAAGESVHGTERLTPGRWCAYAAEAGGRAVTVAVFDHPANPREALWFSMTAPFAYLSATMNLWREPMQLGRDAALRLVYGVAVWDGHVSGETIASAYEDWKRGNP